MAAGFGFPVYAECGRARPENEKEHERGKQIP